MKKALLCFLVLVLLSSLLAGYHYGDPISVISLKSDNTKGEVPVYRFFNTVRGGHLYTVSATERDYILENFPQWTYEGKKFVAHGAPIVGATAVYRFFNTRTGIHFYTISETERDAVMQLEHYNYEGIKYYVFADFAQRTTPVYRFFNHVRGGHLYTISETERDTVMGLPNWTYEGVAFYVHPLAPSPVPRTGQTATFRTGDDGYYQMGEEWPAPRFTDHGNGTVTDNLTGLMWTKNTGLSGLKYWDSAINWCNNLDYAGYNDWRLPNALEQFSLIDVSKHTPALPNSHPFTNVSNETFWSSTTDASDQNWAWHVIIDHGIITPQLKTTNRYAWAVRGLSNGTVQVPKTGQTTAFMTGDDGYYQMGAEWPVPRFTDHINGTVTDNLTGLMWTKNAIPAGAKNWSGAIDWCNAHVHFGYSDWRLPNIRELFSLIDFSSANPPLMDGHPFTNVQSESYWSSTTRASDPGYAWQWLLYYGSASVRDKTEAIYVWPVRSTQ